ncbi:MAG: SRPBCC family protein [Vicinamibacterales bacterium]|jgi:hypothetical protein|nr:SRPBCC family protein [Vicinamibacterales bacterium]
MGCYNSCVVDAPADKVWAALRNFHDLSWAPGVITSLQAVGDAAGDQIGAKRLLNDAFHETLHGLNDADRVVTYSIDDGPDAVSKDKVSGYVGVVRVFSVTDGDGTFVEWSSSWQDSQGGVKEFCDPIYKALLDSLKQHFAA